MLGMRTIKTGIAIVITLFVAEIFHLTYPFFAVIATFIAMQSSIDETYQSGIGRILGTALGGFGGILYTEYLASQYQFLNSLFIGMLAMANIYILNRFKWNKAIQISLIVLTSICLLPKAEGEVYYSIVRIFDTIIGIIIAFLVNIFVLPPNHEEKFLRSVLEMVKDEKIKFADRVREGQPIDTESLLTRLMKLKELYRMYRNDTKWSMKKSAIYFASEEDFSKLIKALEEVYTHLKIVDELNPKQSVWNTDESRKKEGEDFLSEGRREVYDYHVGKIMENFEIVEESLKVPCTGYNCNI